MNAYCEQQLELKGRPHYLLLVITWRISIEKSVFVAIHGHEIFLEWKSCRVQHNQNCAQDRYNVAFG